MVNPTTKWAPILSAWSGQNGDCASQQVRSDSCFLLLMTAALRFLKEKSPDEPAKPGKERFKH
jgi:hypothetical protein